ncbi:hypothetical protein AB0J28_02195 [Streptosporangium canum]|uniref:hypothetical protein n=1 Tax=Streptosporangium canum TaxID=324952 RepID=UPI00341A41BC
MSTKLVTSRLSRTGSPWTTDSSVRVVTVSAAVKGNGLGTLIGTRTAGAVSGPSEGYLLDDGSVLLLPKVRHLGPAREIIDTIGVPVDHYAPMTALDLATGRDPGVAKALAVL